MNKITLHSGDNRLTLRRLISEGVRVHSVVTDPPYGLVSVQKRFGKENSKAARTNGNDGSFNRLSRGFMNKQWDGTGIERDPEFWQLIYDILLPGGYVFAFSGSRTGHWQACAMELAGFIMHPMHGWVFGSGFPKASNAERAIDAHRCTRPGRHYESALPKDPRPDDHICDSCEEGDPWEGWGYGTQTQKPALEPIYLAQKPFDVKTGGANLLKHGVGAVNIDGCRVPSEGGQHREGEASQDRRYTENGATNFAAKPGPRGGDPMGRHPANLILDGSPDVIAMFPNTKSGKPGIMRKGVNDGACYGAESRAPGTQMTGFGDEGSAARFFHHFPPDMDPLFYNAKAGKADRAGSKHPTVKPIALMQYLIRHITPRGGIVLDPFAGSGTTAEAARKEGFDCILMEAETEYIKFLNERFGITKPLVDFDDILGESANKISTKRGVLFDDILGS